MGFGCPPLSFSHTLSPLTFDDDADKGERRGAKTKREQELKRAETNS
jgi:hypothetical protein